MHTLSATDLFLCQIAQTNGTRMLAFFLRHLIRGESIDVDDVRGGCLPAVLRKPGDGGDDDVVSIGMCGEMDGGIGA